MKTNSSAYFKEYTQLSSSLEKLPVVEGCEHLQDTRNGFIVSLVYKQGTTEKLDVTVLQRAFPSIIAEMFERRLNEELENRAVYPVVMAPYLSDESAKQCERLNISYMDMSGNCRLLMGSLYVSEQGHPNKFAKKRVAKTIFNPSSSVSPLILRQLMRDVSQPWKLSQLSEKLHCSIGQVSKVKDYLCEQLWAQMSSDGLRILDPQAIMIAWGEAYSEKSTLFDMLDCYSLLSIPEFEETIRTIRITRGLDCFLTGFSGGVRYAPVVRYTKMHLMIRERDLNEFLEVAACKPVESGANVQIHVIPSDELLHDARIIGDQRVASPVQVYLDCMRLKGRGEEMAEAVLAKEILK